MFELLLLLCVYPMRCCRIDTGGSFLKGNKGGKGMAIAGLVTSIVSIVPTIIAIGLGASMISELQSAFK